MSFPKASCFLRILKKTLKMIRKNKSANNSLHAFPKINVPLNYFAKFTSNNRQILRKETFLSKTATSFMEETCSKLNGSEIFRLYSFHWFQRKGWLCLQRAIFFTVCVHSIVINKSEGRAVEALAYALFDEATPIPSLS